MGFIVNGNLFISYPLTIKKYTKLHIVELKFETEENSSFVLRRFVCVCVCVYEHELTYVTN